MYWSYYLNLERSVLDLERYVTFDKTNFECFSIEFIKIYQVICSEIDVVLKLITNKINMEEYKKYLLKKPEYIKIKQSKVVLESNKDIKLCPFVLLEEGKNLGWWGNYNDVKHERVKENNYKKANLSNVLNSLCALYILESFYYQINFYDCEQNLNNSVPTPKSKLFSSIDNLKDNVVENMIGLIMQEC